MLARVLLAQARPGQSLALLDRLHLAAVTHDRAGSLIEIQALRALALAVSGEETAAVAALAGALTLACPQGYVRVFAIGNTKRFIPQTRRQIWLQNQTPQDTALPPGQEARPRPGHQGRPGGSQRHRAGREPRLISGPVAAAVVTAGRFAKQAAGQQREPASSDAARGRSQTITKTAAPARYAASAGQ